MTMDQMNLVTFGMSAVSLVGAVVQLAMIDSADAESIYRNYLGKVACCHFSLVRLCILCAVYICRYFEGYLNLVINISCLRLNGSFSLLVNPLSG